MKIKNFHILTFLLLLLAGFSLSSCLCDDVYPSETDWSVNPTDPVLTGVITTAGGGVLANAQVTLTTASGDVTVATDAQGKYSITQDLVPGTYTIQAAYPTDADYVSVSGSVTLKYNTISQWDALLYAQSTQATTSTDAQNGTTYSISMPDVVGKGSSVTQIATYYVPDGALTAGDKLSLSAYYDLSGTTTRATYSDSGSQVIIVCESSATSGATTTADSVTIRVNGLINPTKIVHAGQEVTDFHNETEGDTVYTSFKTKTLGRTEFYFPIEISSVTSTNVAVTLSPSSFTGLADSFTTTFTYYTGRGVEKSGTFLDQYVLLLESNSADLKQTSDSYTIDCTIPAGQKLFVTGTQLCQEYSYRCNTTVVPVKKYTDVSYTLSDRQHTGGSN